ncbi:hypothetical protein B6N60_03185 [Richelia sinica FACHB-800]|jgi:hypothetical protein|uniref:Uncharacterized protein n=1 Tax=Richelia sinica FACHB-800 TaxID=1357546 RepID=A0A975Y5Q4_9NOST|nr:hypothetical protein B6N60_03185 [Richelia sinica FACHB-800]
MEKPEWQQIGREQVQQQCINKSLQFVLAAVIDLTAISFISFLTKKIHIKY